MNSSWLLRTRVQNQLGLSSTVSVARASSACKSASRVGRSNSAQCHIGDAKLSPLPSCLPGHRWRPVAASRTVPAAGAGFGAAQPDDFRSAELDVSNAVSPDMAATVARSKGLSGLAARLVFGTALGVVGALVILTGGWCYMLCACFIAYQASQEYFGFLTSKARSQSFLADAVARHTFPSRFPIAAGSFLPGTGSP